MRYVCPVCGYIYDEAAELVSMEALCSLIASDLSEGYPAVRAAASGEEDRGTLRVCT